MNEPIRITCLSDLDRAVALKLCHEPPLSKRRAIHESGVWRWVDNRLGNWCILCRMLREQCAECCSRAPKPHWSPAPFTTCPMASKLLRDRMRTMGWRYQVRVNEFGATATFQRGTIAAGPSFHGITPIGWGYAEADAKEEYLSVALASARALGLELDLQPGWDQK